MHHFLSNSRSSTKHSAYLANTTTTKEPHIYAQAILDPNWQKSNGRRVFRLAAKSNVDLDTVTRWVETHRMQMGL